jgi:nucleoside-triphosphatase THEP1
LIVLTGEIGSGKTTYCAALVRHVQANGGKVCGLLSVGTFMDGVKVAIDLHDLNTGQSRRLATRRPQPDPASPTPNWHFDDDALRWGDAVLAAVTACDLLVIDELGPLELHNGAGYQAAFDAIERRAYRLACVVVRRSLVDVFTQRFAVDAVYDIG